MVWATYVEETGTLDDALEESCSVRVTTNIWQRTLKGDGESDVTVGEATAAAEKPSILACSEWP